MNLNKICRPYFANEINMHAIQKVKKTSSKELRRFLVESGQNVSRTHRKTDSKFLSDWNPVMPETKSKISNNAFSVVYCNQPVSYILFHPVLIIPTKRLI